MMRSLPLVQICARCREQLHAFAQHLATESDSCDELLRRAVTGDSAALDALMEISLPYLKRYCSHCVTQECEDLVQTAAFRLVWKFQNRNSPFAASTFAAYRSYLKLTMRRLCINIQERTQQHVSLDYLAETIGYEPASAAHPTLATLRMQRCLELLIDPLQRVVFYYRFLQGLSVAETRQELQRRGLEVTKEHIFRAAERSIRYLSSLPEIRELFESDGETPESVG